MSNLFYKTIVGIALGEGYEARAMWDLVRAKPHGLASTMLAICLKIATYPHLQEKAEEIVLAHAAYLADGGPVDDRMRDLIAAWCVRRLKGVRRKGRPSKRIKGVAVGWAFVERYLADPSAKREAIIEDVAKEFRLKRRQVFGLIKGVDPEKYAKAD